MSNERTDFLPDWTSPPGDTVSDLMKERGWNQAQLSGRLGVSEKHLNRLIKGKVALTDEMAFRLATVLGSTEQFWLRRDAEFRQKMALSNSTIRYRDWHDWLREFPLPQLKKAGILSDLRLSSASKTKFVEELLTFFSIATPEQWHSNYRQMQARFRRTPEHANLGALTAWLRQGEKEVETILRDAYYGERHELRYDEDKFRSALDEIRNLTTLTPEEFQRKMQVACENAGVILIFVPSIPKAKVSGVARWINRQCPIIQLSLLGKSNDRFWFSFFHEAAHILLHTEAKENIFLDDKHDSDCNSSLEKEANAFAENLLIPAEHQTVLREIRSRHDLMHFAREINIHPGIVVGRLQKEQMIPYGSRFNKLKETSDFLT